MAFCFRKLAKASSTVGFITTHNLVNNTSSIAPRLVSILHGRRHFCTHRTTGRNTKFQAAHPLTPITEGEYGLCSVTIDKSLRFRELLEDDVNTGDQDFQRWSNGGGTFHNAAIIHPTAVIEIGAVVHHRAVVGSNVIIGSGSIVAPAVEVGQSTRIGYNVALTNCTIGDFCVIHNGVCIGQDGFGFLVDEHGNVVKKPQLLKIRIGDHVEIGANTCIDRGSWRDTTIGDHTKIDNLVQIGHNVVIGKSCLICGQVGIAGSATLGDYVTLGGRVAIRDHVCIAPKVRLAANSCVTKNISDPGDYGGFPAIPIREWRRQIAIQRRTLK